MERNFLLFQYLLDWIYNLRQMTIVFNSVLLVHHMALPFSHKKVSAKYFESSFLNVPLIWDSVLFQFTQKVGFKKHNCRENTPHIRSKLFSYQVKHVKTTTITNANITCLCFRTMFSHFTLCTKAHLHALCSVNLNLKTALRILAWKATRSKFSMSL